MVLQKTPIANVFASGGSESKECVVLWQDTHCVRVRKVAVEKGIPHKESLQEGLQSWPGIWNQPLKINQYFRNGMVTEISIMTALGKVNSWPLYSSSENSNSSAEHYKGYFVKYYLINNGMEFRSIHRK